MEKLKKIVNSESKLVGFWGVFVLFFAFSIIKNVDETMYPCDSGLYYSLSKTFVFSPKFWTEFPLSIRGYFYPFLLFVFCELPSKIAFSYSFWFKLFNSLFLSMFITIVIPSLLVQFNKVKCTLLRKLVFGAFIIFFWEGLVLYPLSDIVSLCLLLLGILLIFRIVDGESCGFLKGILAGGCFYGAYCTRAVYLYAFFAVMILYIIYIICFKDRKVTSILGIFMGFIIVALPQILINYNNSEVVSIKPNSEVYSWTVRMPGDPIDEYYGGEGMFENQLWNGITGQYANTLYIEDSWAIGYFLDDAGILLFKSIVSELPEETNWIEYFSVKNYIVNVVKHPLEFCAIYMRHVINGLNPISGSIYWMDYSAPKIHKTILNYLILTIFVIYGWNRIKSSKISDKKAIYKNIMFTVSMWLPSILMIPAIVETRYFISSYVFMYLCVCYMFSYKEKIIAKNKQMIIPIVFVFFILLSIWDTTIANLNYTGYIGGLI